jgi:hypothetical protein
MAQKILYGTRLPHLHSPGSWSQVLIGAHSPKIKSHPDFVAEVLSHNPDGTTTVRLVKRFPDDQLSKLKKSTLAPDSWSDEKVIAVTQQVGDTPAIATRVRDGATLHRQRVDGVEWEVIKDVSGDVTSAYPTGGKPTAHF